MCSGSSCAMHQQPPLHRVQVRTADPQVGHQVLRGNYLDFDVRLTGDRQRFCFTYAAVAGSGFSLARMSHSMAADVALDATGDLVIASTLRAGRWQLQAGREQVRATPAMSLLAPQRGELRASWDDVTLDVAALDRHLLSKVAAQITDDEQEPVHFLGMTARSAPTARYWHTLVRHVHDDILAHDEIIAQPLVRDTVAHQLAVGMLAVFPHTSQYRTPRGAPTPTPAVVRRAMEFIHAHAGDSISLTDIAAAARIGPRGLQLAFRRHHDTTPLEYLRRVRLRRAHADLQAADPIRGDTVATIASRWGFTHPSQFSHTYRRHFGHSPSTTLRQ